MLISIHQIFITITFLVIQNKTNLNKQTKVYVFEKEKKATLGFAYMSDFNEFGKKILNFSDEDVLSRQHNDSR